MDAKSFAKSFYAVRSAPRRLAGRSLSALYLGRMRLAVDPAVSTLGRMLWPGTKPSAEERESMRCIEAERSRLLADDSPLVKQGAPALWDDGQTVASACRASTTLSRLYLLFRAVRQYRPERVLEIGTNLGIGSAYIASALRLNGRGRLVTVDGSPHRVSVAAGLHARLGLDNVDREVGLFDDVLPRILPACAPISLAFVDGNHHFAPTLRYFQWIIEHAADDLVIVFDDIRWKRTRGQTGPQMLEAWQHVRRHPNVRASADLSQTGICVASPYRKGSAIHTPRLPLPSFAL